MVTQQLQGKPLLKQRECSYLDVWGAYFSGDYLRQEAIAIATKIPSHLLRDLVTAMELVELQDEI